MCDVPETILLAGMEVRLDGEPKAPPSAEDLPRLLDYAGVPLPEEYLDVMRRMDGLHGFFGGEGSLNYSILDSCRTVIEINEAFGLRRQGSPLFAVGGNGGGTEFLFDQATGEWLHVEMVSTGLAADEFRFHSLRSLMNSFVAGTPFGR